MKKGLVIGLCVGMLVAGAIVGAVLLIINLTTFRPRTDGYDLSKNTYDYTACMEDAYASNHITGDWTKAEYTKIHKTGYYTDDGFPIWVVGADYPAYEIISVPGASWRCYIGTTSIGAYKIQLEVNGGILKTYEEVKVVDENGKKATLTNTK